MPKRANGGKGLTVAGVAAALGMHHSTVSRWERGESMPSEADTAAVLAIYGVTGEERDPSQSVQEWNDLLIRHARAAYLPTNLTDLEPPATQELPLLHDDIFVEEVHDTLVFGTRSAQ